MDYLNFHKFLDFYIIDNWLLVAFFIIYLFIYLFFFDSINSPLYTILVRHFYACHTIHYCKTAWTGYSFQFHFWFSTWIYWIEFNLFSFLFLNNSQLTLFLCVLQENKYDCRMKEKMQETDKAYTSHQTTRKQK